MGRILTWQSEDAWTFLFVTGLRSRKVADVRHSGHVTLIFQKENEAYVSLAGHARLIDEEGAVRALWNEKAYGHHFPAGDDRANAGFIEAKIVRMEL